MDEEYVQAHILTGGVIAPVGGASPTHSWPLTTISLGIVSTDESSTRLQYRQAAALHRSPRLHLFTDHRVVITAERRLGELLLVNLDYGVKAADYTPVGAALLWTLEQGSALR